MALDVWIGDPSDPTSTLAASFDPEAFYWFLYPLIEQLRESHGKYIDLYDGCEFKPQELGLIRTFIADAEALVGRQPSRFSVHVGTQVEPIERKLYVEVDRGAFLGFLSSLRSAADRCLDTGKSMRFYGD